MDIFVTELGSGGEVQVRNNDIVVCNGYENQPYLCMFGGNDWWGNGLLVQGDNQFVSQTETAIKNNPLTSAGLIQIEEAINNDLQFLTMVTGTSVNVDVSIPTPNRLNVNITINGQQFYLNWNSDSLFLSYSLIE